jgi:membrane protein implicated in regulation of membrane protease activity
MDWLFTAYCICLAVGIGYTIVAFALGEISSAVGHVGHVGDMQGSYSHDYGVQGNEGHGHSSGTDTGGHALLFGPFSPLVIAFFLTTLGGMGIILIKLTPVGIWSLPIAMGAGLFLAWLLLLFLNNVVANVQGSTDINLHTLVGIEAEVTVAIPALGTGEIAYIAAGQRNLTPARSEDHTDIPRYATVRIVRIVGNIFQVRLAESATTAPTGAQDAPPNA